MRPPLCRFLLVLFLAKQEKYMTALTYYEKAYILVVKRARMNEVNPKV